MMAEEMKNKELELAWQYVTRTSMNVFLTGKAGTGKTTFLKKVVQECPKKMVVLAPTGVAAINAGGVTLHSFFQLPFGLFLPEYEHVQAHDKQGRYRFHKNKRKLMQSMELMIIDEVSMLRADIMDELDALLRKIRRNPLPFGGVQVLMIGDTQQLSPVVRDEEWEVIRKYYPSPYFFDAHVLRQHPYRLIQLNQVYRQRDPGFISILESVREGRLTPEVMERLNSRYIPDYVTPEGCITLCTHNTTARSINDAHLAAIHSPAYSFKAEISGNFPENMYPQDVELVLKKGAQVMFTKNDPDPERLYVNGTIGTVSYIDKEDIVVRLEDGMEIEVQPQPWENLKYDINEETKEIVSAIDGLFTQYPLKTAWAITIHKSQGLTFDKAVIDASHSFSHGQVYVALSRCRSLEGMVLKHRITPGSIIKDPRVEAYDRFVSSHLPTTEELEQDKQDFYRLTLEELFDLEALKKDFQLFLKYTRVTVPDSCLKSIRAMEEAEKPFLKEMYEVSVTFLRSLGRIVGEDYATSPYLQERLRKASAYFSGKAKEILLPLLKDASRFPYEDKLRKKLYKQYLKNFMEGLFLKILLWNTTKEGFDLETFLDLRSGLYMDLTDISFSKALALLARSEKGASGSRTS